MVTAQESNADQTIELLKEIVAQEARVVEWKEASARARDGLNREDVKLSNLRIELTRAIARHLDVSTADQLLEPRRPKSV